MVYLGQKYFRDIMTFWARSRTFLIGIILTLGMLFGVSYASAQSVPKYMSYQGELTDSSNNPVTATVSVEFKLYNALSGGSELWSETQSVSVTNGFFSVQLGSVTPLTLDFDQQYFLSLNVASDGEMSPRQPINSVGYAFASDVTYGTFATGTAPTAATGTLYFDTGDSNLYVHDGSSWLDLTVTTSTILGGTNTFTAANTFSATTTHSGTLLIPDGSYGNPGIAFADDTDLGLYRLGSDELGFGIGSSGTYASFNTNRFQRGISQSWYLRNQIGTALVPTYAFGGDVDTGIYSPGDDQISVSAGGTSILDITGTSATVNATTTIASGILVIPEGDASNPGLTFGSVGSGEGLRTASDLMYFYAGGSQRFRIGGSIRAEVLYSGPAGSAVATTYAKNDDADTGMYFPAANEVALAAGGSGVLSLSSSNVTSSEPLIITDAAGGNGLLTVERSGGTRAYIQSQTALGVVGVSTNHALAFATNAGVRGRFVSTGALEIGANVDPDHGGTGDGDLVVGDSLEVDGTAYFDGSMLLADGQDFLLGTGSDATLQYNTTQTNDSLFFGVGSDSRSLIIAEKADQGVDFGHSAQTNPKLFVHSADATQTSEWIGMYHDGTRGLLQTGTGTLRLSPNDGIAEMVANNITFNMNDSAGVGLPTLNLQYLGSTVGQFIAYSTDKNVRVNAADSEYALILEQNNTDLITLNADQTIDIGLTTTTITGALALPTSTAATPALRFTEDGDSGIYSTGSNFSLATAGTERLRIGSYVSAMSSGFAAPDGGVAGASYAHADDPNTGMYFPADDQVSFTAGGTSMLDITSSGLVINASTTISSGAFKFQDGSSAAPSISFGDDTDTGIYRVANNTIGFTVGGSQTAVLSSGIFSSNYFSARTSDFSVLLRGTETDNASAVAVKLGNQNSLTTSGAKITGFYSDGGTTLEAYVDKDGNFAAGDGSVSAPAFTFATDTDTGIYIPSGDTIGFGTNGAERVQISNTTTSVSNILAVQGALSLVSSGGAGVIASPANTPIVIAPAGTPQITAVHSGNTGIGTTTPAYILHVAQSSTGDTLAVQDSNGTCTIDPGGAADWSCSSDLRLKTNIQSLSYGLSEIMALNPVSYEWHTQTDDEQRMGLIAQEVEEVIPELVTTHATGYKALAYGGFMPIVLNAIQEQQAQIAALQSGGVLLNPEADIASDNMALLYRPVFSGDMVGEAYIAAGQVEAKVRFGETYEYQPIVTVTPQEFVQGAYRVTNITTSGFTVQMQQSQLVPVTFAWHSFSSEDAEQTTSGGVQSPVTVEHENSVPEVEEPAAQETEDPAEGEAVIVEEEIVEEETLDVDTESEETIPEETTDEPEEEVVEDTEQADPEVLEDEPVEEAEETETSAEEPTTPETPESEEQTEESEPAIEETTDLITE